MLVLSVIVVFSVTLLLRYKEIRDQKIVLLYKTNHNVLLNACRQLYKEGYRGEYDLHTLNSECKNIPKVLLALKPEGIFINESMVSIGVIGGIGGFGVHAYPEGCDKPYTPYETGLIKLIDGLCYYDSHYREGHKQEFEQYLHSLRPKDFKEN